MDNQRLPINKIYKRSIAEESVIILIEIGLKFTIHSYDKKGVLVVNMILGRGESCGRGGS